MISPKSSKSSPIPVPKGDRPIYAYSDPTIFKNERVLRTLISRELKHCTTTSIKTVQTDLLPGMRREVASWMLEVRNSRQKSFVFPVCKMFTL